MHTITPVIIDDLGYDLGLVEDPATGLLVTLDSTRTEDGLDADEETEYGYITYV